MSDELYVPSGPNRYICTVLDEMRKAHETRNYSYLLGLIEEAQSLANRMESSLNDQKDIKRLSEVRTKLRKEVDDLKAQRKELKDAATVSQG